MAMGICRQGSLSGGELGREIPSAIRGRKTRVTRRGPSEILAEGPGSASGGTKAEGEDVDLSPLCPGDYYDIDEVRKR
ncbi:hypothetical protein HanIR_Chr10g0497371 [Helianthus annuus]|nr:hypothetical protein HanIR_Chr10g0497371 [Helianthus annuus]